MFNDLLDDLFLNPKAQKKQAELQKLCAVLETLVKMQQKFEVRKISKSRKCEARDVKTFYRELPALLA